MEKLEYIFFSMIIKEDINRHVAVRNYLRDHAEAARQYGDLKEQLAWRFSDDIEAYIIGKDTYVKALEKRAMRWYKS